MSTRLLVSVSNASEAIHAVDGGADIIDVKDPLQGPLGFAGRSAIAAVTAAVGEAAPVSAALGECVDWTGGSGVPVNQNMRLPAGLAFVKMGLSGMCLPETQAVTAVESGRFVTEQTSEPAWQTRLQTTTQQFAATNHWNTAESSPAWIGVVYADYEKSQAPAPDDVLLLMREYAAGILIDTWDKQGGSAVECLSERQLMELRDNARMHGLLFALAGKITLTDMALVHRLAPDVVAVRGAVCDNGDRRSPVVASRVRALKDALA